MAIMRKILILDSLNLNHFVFESLSEDLTSEFIYFLRLYGWIENQLVAPCHGLSQIPV